MILQRLLDIMIHKNRIYNDDSGNYEDEDYEVELNNILNGELDEEIKCNSTTHDDFWDTIGYPLIQNAVEADLGNLAQTLLRHAKVCVLEHGEDKWVKYTNNNQKCLDIACRNENTSLVKILLEHGTDPDFLSPQGCPPLIPATINQRIDVMKLLLANRADANWSIPNNRWRSALCCACVKGYHDAALLLLDCGADVNAVRTDGDTPLLLTLRFRPESIGLIQLLLERGADPSVVNLLGRTALDYAEEGSEVAQMLINAQLEPILK